MEQIGTYGLIIGASVVLILSFLFSELARRTNVPSVLMLIILGVALKFGLEAYGLAEIDFNFTLGILGVVGLIMIVLEAALELKLSRDKLLPIGKAFLIAAVGLLISTYVAAEILKYYIEGLTHDSAMLYATALSILSSAIIIPSVGALRGDKKEFHIYESTFSDILGIIVFYYLAGPFEAAELGTDADSLPGYLVKIVITVFIAILASYVLVIIFQKLRSHVKLFLLIAILLLEYAIGKSFHLSSLIIILVFGLMFANVRLFFSGPLRPFLKPERAHEIYEGLHVVTLETAFVVRTFFFVIFGLTIDPTSLLSLEVAGISALIIASIYLIRYVLLRIFIGRDLFPQLFVAPRGLITVLLYSAIPISARAEGFQPGILLFVIIGTALIMTFAMIRDKNRAGAAIRRAESLPVDLTTWQAPSLATTAEAD